jgi:DNA modification methylase
VWEIPFNSGKQSIKSFGRKETKSNWGHSGFPVELPETCILLSTKENDIVLDCFMGSGTTGVACVQNNRKYIGIELNAEYCEIARERIKESEEYQQQELVL